MPQPILQLWEFVDAPDTLRTLAAAADPNGWLAFIDPCAQDIVEFLIDRGSAGCLPVLRYETENGGIVLAGSITKNRVP